MRPHVGAHAASIITQLIITPGPVLTPTLRDILGILAPSGAGLSSPAPENYQTRKLSNSMRYLPAVNAWVVSGCANSAAFSAR